ncbi:MAG TPA: hypothetical protein VKP30_04360, partial [Polyangiaceae bacterium]|nr:hypothetical protein [Polyangiaceae bacterium]
AASGLGPRTAESSLLSQERRAAKTAARAHRYTDSSSGHDRHSVRVSAVSAGLVFKGTRTQEKLGRP